MIFTALKCILAPVIRRQAEVPTTVEDVPACLPIENGVVSSATSAEYTIENGVVSSAASAEYVDLEAQKGRSEVSEVPNGISKSQTFWARHKPSARVINDFTIGLSDGMTVPFALTAGLSFYGSTKLVLLAGVAELVAGTISMAIGGWLGARGETESYNTKLMKTKQAIAEQKALKMVQDLFGRYPAVSPSTIAALFRELELSPDGLQRFLMRNHHEMAEPESSRPWICAITIGCGYLLGGLLPLIPYFFAVRHDQLRNAFYESLAVMIVALFTFGYVKTGLDKGWKGKDNVQSALLEAIMMLVIGGAAVGFSILVIKGINGQL